MQAIFFLIILLFSTRAYCDDHPHASKGSHCLESERRALLAIKSDLYNSDHWLSSWSSYDCCNWSGVACDNTTSHVIRLDVHYPFDQFASSPDKSKVNPSLFELKYLKYLDLSFNNFSTHVPSMISSLVHLEYLNLSNANFNGLIPQQLGNLSNLRILDLNCYFMQWNVRSDDLSWLSHLTSLEYLDMSYVFLFRANSWFHQINYNSLEVLALSNCSLQDAVGAGTSIMKLNSSSNQIEGNISVNAKKLKYLDLSGNSLTRVPLDMGNLIQLEYLDLQHNQITKEILLSLGNLINLEYLNLFDNEIFGEIPLSIGNLTSLIYLDMSYNAISGRIPDVLCNFVYLEEIILFGNDFYGEIPKNISKLHNLLNFEVSVNKLTGQIPLSLADLCNLEGLGLSHNNISGELTNLLDGLSKCPQGSNLQSFDITDNMFSGLIPLSLGQLAQLQYLDISWNSLQGNVTEAHLSHLTNLKHLDICHNSLNVILSDDWLPPFDAEFIDMSYCHLGTGFPSWIQTQTNLWVLFLSEVGLHGNIPGWFLDFISINSGFYLSLNSNNLNGQLPSSLPFFMDLSNNSFEGIIPLSYANVEHVGVLKLSNNHFYGSFPPFFCNFTNLFVLDLSSNHLSGEVPNCHGSYPINLNSVHMNNNNLSGSFPSALRYSKELIVLDLGGNKFSGAIPKWVGGNFPFLKFLHLSSNSFHGAIPMSIGNLPSLQILDLSSNNLIGSIPSTIANFNFMSVRQNYSDRLHFSANYSHSPGCKSCLYSPSDEMEYLLNDAIIINAKGVTNEYTTTLSAVASIDLSSNELSGEIPKEITKLRGLCFLNLSDNHLSGRIPENIDVMTELLSLDLSMNHLIGEIPLGLSTLHFLSSLNLSYNNLSGRIPTGGQLATFNDLSYIGNEDLCGVPLPKCPGDETNHSSYQARDKEDNDKLEKVLDYTFIVMGFIVGFWIYLGVIFMKKSKRITFFRMADKMYDWMYVQLSLKFAKLKLQWQK
ncbi:receptor-like protein EIX2 [Zingiber officinale]|nr:receptor-like protein EIX2 [Zingiber officinale]